MESFNINDYIKVKLTSYGCKTHIEYYSKYLPKSLMLNPKNYMPVIDEEGFTKYQLWEFMNIFGEHMTMTAEQVIQNNLIYFAE